MQYTDAVLSSVLVRHVMSVWSFLLVLLCFCHLCSMVSRRSWSNLYDFEEIMLFGLVKCHATKISMSLYLAVNMGYEGLQRIHVHFLLCNASCALFVLGTLLFVWFTHGDKECVVLHKKFLHNFFVVSKCFSKIFKKCRCSLCVLKHHS